MSFQGSSTITFRVTGLKELIKIQQDFKTKAPQANMSIYRESSSFFVLKAKERVHKISGDLARSIHVESITPQRSIVTANMPYARKEEEREGNRRIPPHTPHTYMKPAAADTALQMPKIIKKHYDPLFTGKSTGSFF